MWEPGMNLRHPLARVVGSMASENVTVRVSGVTSVEGLHNTEGGVTSGGMGDVTRRAVVAVE